ncbi:MAG: nicotinate (nicotinamide) nucleotide adenylyltransferase [Tissierellia bacterium]|nr:nicotinate (nicotinamide) nucleotide adenylyltransferase [Tissierellia bacterium]
MIKMEKLTRKRIGIFGGSFDPIHVGHLMLAQAALEFCQLERIFFLPAKPGPFKRHLPMTDAKTRLRMVEIAIQDNPKFEVSELEMSQSESSYSIDTIEALKKQYPGAEIYFIIGADIITQIEGWMTFEELLREVIFLVAYRPSHSPRELESQVQRLKAQYPGDIRLMDFPDIDLSSSYIRRLILSGASARYLVPDPVLEYIKKMGIYANV